MGTMQEELKLKISAFTHDVQAKFKTETKHENQKYLLGVLMGVQSVLEIIQDTADGQQYSYRNLDSPPKDNSNL